MSVIEMITKNVHNFEAVQKQLNLSTSQSISNTCIL